MSDQNKAAKPALAWAFEIVAIVLGGIGVITGLLAVLSAVGAIALIGPLSLVSALVGLVVAAAALGAGLLLLTKQKLGLTLIWGYILGVPLNWLLGVIIAIITTGGLGIALIISAAIVGLILGLLGPAFFFILLNVPATKVKEYYTANLA